MPAEVVNSRLLPAQGQECINIMDDYGTEFHLYVPVVATAAARQASIAGAITQQTNNEASLEAYAASHGLDLSEQKTAGLAKKQLAKGA